MNAFLKRTAALGLAAVLMLPLAACGKGSDTVAPNNSPAAEATATPEPTPTPTPDPYDAVRNYWSEDQLTPAWVPDQLVDHLFFHPVIAYP